MAIFYFYHRYNIAVYTFDDDTTRYPAFDAYLFQDEFSVRRGDFAIDGFTPYRHNSLRLMRYKLEHGGVASLVK